MKRTMKGPAKQRGMTAIGWLMVGGVAGVVVIGVVKLIPIFIDHQTVKSVLEQIATTGSAKNPGEIRERMLKLLDVNNVKSLPMENVEIDRAGTNFKVTVKYENRVNYMGPVDFVVHYNDVQEIPVR